MSKRKNPWETISKKQVYENSWIKVEEHQVLNPALKEGIYGVVKFKHLAIAIVPLDESYNTWLVGQHRYPLDRYSWEVPEGGGELGIDPLETAQRELLEETGIKAKDWQQIQEIDTSNSVTDERGIVFLAQELSFFEPSPDEDEELKIRKLSLEEAFQMVLDGEIRDGLAVAALYKAHYMLKNNLL